MCGVDIRPKPSEIAQGIRSRRGGGKKLKQPGSLSMISSCASTPAIPVQVGFTTKDTEAPTEVSRSYKIYYSYRIAQVTPWHRRAVLALSWLAISLAQ